MVLPKAVIKTKMVVLTKTSNTTYSLQEKQDAYFRADAFGNSVIVEISHKAKLHITC